MNKKMKFDKRHILRLGILLGVYALIVLLLMRFKYAYGSDLDWNGQHYAIPDYFRKLFYDTGEFFPSFAPNIGAGENIYYLSYYGLYSPIILISYLLPFVKMSTYIQVVSIIGIAVDVVLFYIFMNRKFKENTAFMLSFLFLFSNCLVFHSHRHVMFVNYMPFLILGLMAIEDYFFKRRNVRVCVYSFLIILCSYYFSIPALLAMTVYGVYCYFKSHENSTFREFIICGSGFALRVLIGIMMAGVLLLPTMAVMLCGRDGTNSDVKLSSLLPRISLDFITGDHYSMGLSCFLITACIIGIMSKDKARRFLCIVMGLLISCPVFVYVLNAGMYIDAKVLIPFMPIGIIIMGDAYEDLINHKCSLKPIIIATAIALIWGGIAYHGKHFVRIAAYADAIVLLVCLFGFWKYKKENFLKVAILSVMCITTLVSNFTDKMPTMKEINTNDSSDVNMLAEYAAEDDNLFRISYMVKRARTPNFVLNARDYSSTIYSSLHNEDYNNFYFHEIRNENEFRNSALTTASKNVLFKALMGEKYIITDSKNVPTGYEKIKSSGKVSLYKNDNVLPMGYACDMFMSENEYKKLDYPENVEALMNYIIVPEQVSSGFESKITNGGRLKVDTSKNISENGNGYSINSKKDFERTVKLNEPLKKDQVMLLRFDVDNSEKPDNNDTIIKINGVKNKLTTPDWKYFNNNKSFEYVITTEGKYELKSIDIEFSKGVYKISGIESYIMDYPNVLDHVDCFKADKSKTGGDVIEGSIECSSDEWFNLSIPYDKGFLITVDGKTQEYSETDTAFIGFPISKGSHNVKIEFIAPLLQEGKMLSLLGFILLFMTVAVEFVIRKKNR